MDFPSDRGIGYTAASAILSPNPPLLSPFQYGGGKGRKRCAAASPGGFSPCNSDRVPGNVPGTLIMRYLSMRSLAELLGVYAGHEGTMGGGRTLHREAI